MQFLIHKNDYLVLINWVHFPLHFNSSISHLKTTNALTNRTGKLMTLKESCFWRQKSWFRHIFQRGVIYSHVTRYDTKYLDSFYYKIMKQKQYWLCKIILTKESFFYGTISTRYKISIQLKFHDHLIKF